MHSTNVKDEYILRSLSKIKHKKYEHFVVTRLIHRLDDRDIEFVCQQRVRRPDGVALTDLFFPQFDLHLEIDEQHHNNAQNRSYDALRKQDIIDATNHRVENLAVYQILSDGSAIIKPLSQISKEVDAIVEELKTLKKQLGSDFVPWNPAIKFDPTRHIANGFISTSSDAVFRYQKDAMACFGYTGGHYQRAMWRVKNSNRVCLWFPRLWNTGRWNNSLSEDGKTITESNLADDGRGDAPPEIASKRIVFAKWEDPLGNRVYRFAGVFEYHRNASSSSKRVYKRSSDTVDLVNP